MALHIKTIGGRKYVYDVKSYRDKDTKKVKKQTTYMGPLLDEEDKSFKPKRSCIVRVHDRNILHYGDTYILHKCLSKSVLSSAFSDVLSNEQDTLNAFLFYKIIVGEASKDANIWYEGSYAKLLFPNARLESQRVSEFFGRLGKENVQRSFFKKYITEIAKTSGDVVIDSTGLENEIDIPLTEFSGKPGSVQNETRMILVVDRLTHMPLYFRLVAGNIVDVSTLTTTFSLAKKLGLTPSMILMDAGYYSDKNIKALFKAKTSFLTRLPASRKLYKQLIMQTNDTLETAPNIIVYNKRSLYVQKVKTPICGYSGYAYVCSDILQHGQKMDRFARDAKDEKLTEIEIAKRMPYIGKFILVSDKEISPDELLPLFYTRQVAETTFAFSKTSLTLLPLRVHTLQNLRGYTFLSYLALLLSIEIQQKLKGLCTLQDALAIANNQFCEIYGHDVIPLEPNRQLKDIYKKLDLEFVVVNFSGE